MRIPDPKANTTTEAYLAYKAGFLEAGELKPSLYEPNLHFDAWLAYWAGLINDYPTDENNNPEMLCDEEALVAYLSGATDTYPEAVKDPYDVRIVGYLKYLVSARFGRPEYPVNNQEFYLSTMKPPVVPSGDTPATDIELDGTAEAPFIDLKMFGDTKQNSYKGLNMVNFTSGSNYGVTCKSNGDGSITISGLCTQTIRESVCGSSQVLTPGTYVMSIENPLPFLINFVPKAGVSWRLPAGATSATNTINEDIRNGTLFMGMVEGTTYNSTVKIQLERSKVNLGVYRIGGGATVAPEGSGFTVSDTDFGYMAVSLDKSAVSKRKIKLFFNSTLQGVGAKIYKADTAGGNLSWLFGGRAFTSGEEIEMPDLSSYAEVYVVFYVNDSGSGTTGVSEITYSDISALFSPMEFEPYVGGVLSPNTSYPQDVNTVTGRQLVDVESKNMVFTNARTNRGIEFSYDEETGETMVTGTTADTYAIAGTNIHDFPAGEYTLSIDSPQTFNVGIGIVGKNGVRKPRLIPKGSTKVSFNTDFVGLTYDIYISGFQAGENIDGKFKVQFERGSEATEFVKHQEGDYEINLGKNLWDMRSITTTSAPLNIEGPDDEGAYTLSWTGGFNAVLSPITGLDSLETYTISFEHIGEALSIREIGAGSSYLGNTTQDSSYTKYQFVVSGKTGLNLEFIRRSATTNVSASVKNFQIELGSEATTYAPYFEPVELCKVGEVQDKIYRNEDGEWCLHKEVGKVVLNGSETFGRIAFRGITGWAYYYTTIIDGLVAVGYNPVLSDKFTDLLNVKKEQLRPGLYEDYPDTPIANFVSCVVFTLGDTNILRFSMPDSVVSSAAAFKSWLAENNVSVYYKLADVEDTIITNQALVDQLNALFEGGSYEGKTYIELTATDPNLPAGLIVEAAKYA